MRYDLARGRGLMRATGDRAASWLGAALVAGNDVSVIDSPGLVPMVDALHAEGVDEASLRVELGDVARFIRLGAEPSLEVLVCDRGPFRSIARATGPTAPEQRALRALRSADRPPTR